jgi:hypothetical protein
MSKDVDTFNAWSFFDHIFRVSFEDADLVGGAARASARGAPVPSPGGDDDHRQQPQRIAIPRAQQAPGSAVDVADIAPGPPSPRSRRRSLTPPGERRRRGGVVHHPLGGPERARQRCTASIERLRMHSGAVGRVRGASGRTNMGPPDGGFADRVGGLRPHISYGQFG